MPLFRRGDPLGHYRGKHYTEYVETVKELKRAGKNDEAIKLLVALLPAVEDEGRIHRITAPWYYEQLAILFRKDGDYDAEIEVIENYIDIQQGNPTSHAAIVARLPKAKELKRKSEH